MTATVAVFGSLVLLMLGWMKLDLDRRLSAIEAGLGRLEQRVTDLAERLDEREAKA